MPVGISEDEGNVVEVEVRGKPDKKDYELFVPEVERRFRTEGKLRVLLRLSDFHGWTAGALWEDVKFDVKHFNDVERLAIVGEKKWQKGMATFCKPFTTARIRYFDHSQEGEARRWIEEQEAVESAQASGQRG